jgi:hypothetical protein
LAVTLIDGTVSVAPGGGVINGYWYRNTELTTVTLPPLSFARTDSVVLRLNKATRAVSVVSLIGSSSTPPILTRNSDVWELRLANLSIAANSTTPGSIADTRQDAEQCGIIAPALKEAPNDGKQYARQNQDWAKIAPPETFATAAQGAKADTAVQPGNLAEVATSGKYADLQNKPTIPQAPVNADWNATSGLAQIQNKPTIPQAPVNADWNATSGLAQIQNKPTVIPDAPNDGKKYIRKNGAWVETDIVMTESAFTTSPPNVPDGTAIDLI